MKERRLRFQGATYREEMQLHVAQSLSSAAPEQLWKQAITEFATRRGLPLDDVVGGKPFACNAYVFRLQYNVDVDPHGLVVMLDLGAIPAHAEDVAQLEMLAHNVRRPALLAGYYGILPGTRHGVFCARLDIRKTQVPAALIAHTVESLALAIPVSQFRLKQQIKAFTGLDPEALDAPAPAR
jgi:hypothetical protein